MSALTGFVRRHRALLVCGLLSETVWLLLFLMPRISLLPGFARLADAFGAVWPTAPVFLALPLYWIAYRRVRRDAGPFTLPLVVGFAAAFAVTLLLVVAPLQSKDAYGYIVYGKAPFVYGDKPYEFTVARHPEEPLYSQRMPWIDWPNPYGPFWTSLSMAMAAVILDAGVDAQLLAFKALAAVFFGLLAASAVVLAEKVRGGPVRADARAAMTLLIAWNPVLLLEIVQNGHNDGVMIFFLILSIILIDAGALVASAGALVLSTLTKYGTAIVGPLFVAYLAAGRAGVGMKRSFLDAITYMATGIVLTLLICMPFWAGGQMLRGLQNQSGLITLWESSPGAWLALRAAERGIIFPASLDPTVAALAFLRVAFVAFFVAFMFIFWGRIKNAKTLTATVLAMFVAYFLLFNSWFMPWYFVWIIPLLAVLGRDREAFAASCAAPLCYRFPTHRVLLGLVVAIVAASALRWAARRIAPSAAALLRRMRRRVTTP